MKDSKIDWEEIKFLLKRQVKKKKIAEHVGVCRKTMYNRCKKEFGMSWQEFGQKYKGIGLNDLRLKQFEMALDKENITMLIFLGKNYLNQSDRVKQDINEHNSFIDWLNHVKNKRTKENNQSESD